MKSKLIASFTLALAAALSAAPTGCGGAKPASLKGGLIEASIVPAQHLDSTPELLDLGKTTFEKQCAPCHGAAGDGQGEAAYLLYPRPRDFTRGEFRLVSTWEGIPTDEDLFRTISRGMPGSAMPSWAHLPERTRWGLVHYVKSFSKTPLKVAEAHNPASPLESGAGVIQPPPEPPYTPAAAGHARDLFLQNCAACHGASGKGDGQQEMKDSKGFPTRPRDLTAGVFKGAPAPDQIYRRVVAGLPGSPMPQNPILHGQDGWDLAHYVLSLSGPEQRAKVEMRRYRVVAKRVKDLPSHPDSGTWNDAEAVDLHLMPLWWRPERPEEVTVKAVHDGKDLALLLVWPDSTYDHTAIRPQDFRDACAVELAGTQDPPFFAMGQRGDPVNIWMWKSERQADMQPAFQEIDKIYPNIGIDSYPNFLRSPLEQPTRNALTLQSDPTYVTAWGAGNIVADPTRRSAAEDLMAQGFGTLRARPKSDQNVDATGVYATGSYRVVLRRSLQGLGPESVALKPGESVPVAFAVWNGSAGDRDGKKSVTIWQELVIEP
jgi:mono/diheme cytochrome c family protein